MTNINLTPILQAVIALAAALITYRLIPWIKARTTEAQQENIRTLVKVLVYAAEQIYGAGNGQNKLDYVCGQMEKRGYTVDRSQIEAAVYEAFNDTGIRPGDVVDMTNVPEDEGADE